jgi:4-hydroxy-4-methyl-2-oxoglutarate aldolase
MLEKVTLDTDLFQTVSSSILSDALEMCGVNGFCAGIVPLALGQRMVGRALTVRISPYNVGAHAHDEYMDDLQDGDVCVLDARGVQGAVWGDLRSIVARKAKVAGLVTDGAVRDTAACAKIGLPIFLRERTPLSGNRRAWIEAKAVPVVIGGVLVRPGDLIFGDDDGVIAIPQALEAEVLAHAEKLEHADRLMTAALQEGMGLAEARLQFGYKKTLPSKP